MGRSDIFLAVVFAAAGTLFLLLLGLKAEDEASRVARIVVVVENFIVVELRTVNKKLRVVIYERRNDGI